MIDEDRPAENVPRTRASWGYIAAIVLGVVIAVAIICAVATIGGRQHYKPFVPPVAHPS